MFKFMIRPSIFAVLLLAWLGAAHAATVPGRIFGAVVDAEDGQHICALLMINGNYQTYSCAGTAGSWFTLDYEYATDSRDTSANTLLVFADNYKNEAVKITQPDTNINIQMRKAEPQSLNGSLVGQWSLWYVDGGLLTEDLPSFDCYSPCAPFQITKDDGATVEGTFQVPAPHGMGSIFWFTATYIDSQTLNWTMAGGFGGSGCADSGTMRIDGHNHLISTNETNSNCWWRGTEHWVRYNR